MKYKGNVREFSPSIGLTLIQTILASNRTLRQKHTFCAYIFSNKRTGNYMELIFHHETMIIWTKCVPNLKSVGALGNIISYKCIPQLFVYTHVYIFRVSLHLEQIVLTLTAYRTFYIIYILIQLQ